MKTVIVQDGYIGIKRGRRSISQECRYSYFSYLDKYIKYGVLDGKNKIITLERGDRFICNGKEKTLPINKLNKSTEWKTNILKIPKIYQYS